MKSSTMPAPVPGTPSMRASPSYVTRLFGVGSCASTSLRVFRLNMRTRVMPSTGVTRPRSTAKHATAANIFPQFGVVSTSR